jgi:hypothetical protein
MKPLSDADVTTGHGPPRTHYRRLLDTLGRKATSWRGKPAEEKLLVAPAFVALGVSRAALLALPFRRIAPWLGREQRGAPAQPPANAGEVARAVHIGRAVRTAARYAPWESSCLAQAMAARALLGARGVPYALFLGLARDPAGGVRAHAWVRTGPAAVTGGRGTGGYSIVATFVSMRG